MKTLTFLTLQLNWKQIHKPIPSLLINKPNDTDANENSPFNKDTIVPCFYKVASDKQGVIVFCLADWINYTLFA